MRPLEPKEPGIRIAKFLEAKELWLVIKLALSRTESALGLLPPNQRRKGSGADPEDSSNVTAGRLVSRSTLWGWALLEASGTKAGDL